MAAQAEVKSMGAEACGIVDPLLASRSCVAFQTDVSRNPLDVDEVRRTNNCENSPDGTVCRVGFLVYILLQTSDTEILVTGVVRIC